MNACLFACSIFIALGVLLIPLAGLQTDEALFGSPLYLNTDNNLWARLVRLDVPVMVMTYLGSLKSFLYLPIFEILGANVWTIRLPMVLAGAATIFVFYHLLISSLNRKAALLGTFLLATDPLFLMTNTFDWGPVAIEHLLLVTGCYLLFRFGNQSGQTGSIWHTRRRDLALGFFCLGLALWNKAIFLWAMAGLGVASVTVLWPWVQREFRWRNLKIAAAAFLLGAAPLIYFNVLHPLATISQNAHLEPQAVTGKWVQLESGLQGTSLFGYIVSEQWMEPAKPVRGVAGGLSERIRDAVGEWRHSGFYYILGALLLLLPLWWRSRAAWFSLVFCGVAWIWMALTHDAGASAHHVVLLWPFPILFASAALRRMPGFALFLAGLAMAGSNLLVTNQYFYQFQRYGAYGTFTDAIFPLSQALDDTAGNTVYVIDWGMFDSLNLLHRGRLKLRNASGSLTPEKPSPAEVEDVERMLLDPQGVFVGHVKGQEAFERVGEHLDARAQAAGFRREILRTIPDTNGRPMFEISRVVSIN